MSRRENFGDSGAPLLTLLLNYKFTPIYVPILLGKMAEDLMLSVYYNIIEISLFIN